MNGRFAGHQVAGLNGDSASCSVIMIYIGDIAAVYPVYWTNLLMLIFDLNLQHVRMVQCNG
jgi:hypothetical protein